jgi:hypothetical protein
MFTEFFFSRQTRISQNGASKVRIRDDDFHNSLTINSNFGLEMGILSCFFNRNVFLSGFESFFRIFLQKKYKIFNGVSGLGQIR